MPKGEIVDLGWFSLMSTIEEILVAQGLGNGPKFVCCKDDSLLSFHG
jgi:hypothetical protein